MEYGGGGATCDDWASSASILALEKVLRGWGGNWGGELETGLCLGEEEGALAEEEEEGKEDGEDPYGARALSRVLRNRSACNSGVDVT